MDRNRIARVKILNTQPAAPDDDAAQPNGNGAQADTSRAS
jgi:hypothetical protein